MRGPSGQPIGKMPTPIFISVAHQLGRAEARQRIEAGFARIIQVLPGGGAPSQRWDGDQLSFDIAAMGQTIVGVVNVLDHEVTIKLELTGVLGMIASGIKDRLQKVSQLLLMKK